MMLDESWIIWHESFWNHNLNIMVSNQKLHQGIFPCSIHVKNDVNYLILFNGPQHFVFKTNISLWFRSNILSQFDCLSCSFGVWPVLPNSVMNTLASVPAPFTFPVTATTSYSANHSTQTDDNFCIRKYLHHIATHRVSVWDLSNTVNQTMRARDRSRGK